MNGVLRVYLAGVRRMSFAMRLRCLIRAPLVARRFLSSAETFAAACLRMSVSALAQPQETVLFFKRLSYRTVTKAPHWHSQSHKDFRAASRPSGPITWRLPNFLYRRFIHPILGPTQEEIGFHQYYGGTYA
jgi:hypothetical protein